jgi:hypothetical protein
MVATAVGCVHANKAARKKAPALNELTLVSKLSLGICVT